MDLLKMLDYRKFKRGERFKVLGLVNEPGFRALRKPDEFGFWLDEADGAEPAGIDEKFMASPQACSVFAFSESGFRRGSAQEMGRRAFHDDPLLQ